MYCNRLHAWWSTQSRLATLLSSLHTKFGIPISKNIGDMHQTQCNFLKLGQRSSSKIVSKYDQEIPQSQTADNPVEMRGRAAQPSRDTRKTN